MAALAVATPALVVSGCGGDSEQPAGTTVAAAPADVTYTTAQANIDTKVGDVFGIKLASNPTTGYRWQMASQKGTGGVSLVRSEYIQGPAKKGQVGVGGHELFTFRADRAGKATITMSYLPPGKTKADKSERFVVTIK